MPAGGLEFTVDQQQLRRVVKQLREEADGKLLRKELVGQIKEALEPLRTAVQSAILSMESGGLEREGEPLRQAIADKVVVEIRTGGRATGAGLKAKRIKIRNFPNAPRRTNARKGWRHPVYGRDVWVNQMGKPGWFDDTIRDRRSEFVGKVHEVMEKMARRIASRSA